MTLAVAPTNISKTIWADSGNLRIDAKGDHSKL